MDCSPAGSSVHGIFQPGGDRECGAVTTGDKGLSGQQAVFFDLLNKGDSLWATVCAQQPQDMGLGAG